MGTHHSKSNLSSIESVRDCALFFCLYLISQNKQRIMMYYLLGVLSGAIVTFVVLAVYGIRKQIKQ